jgi:tetratricopeptide (TPR) repeat protein
MTRREFLTDILTTGAAIAGIGALISFSASGCAKTNLKKNGELATNSNTPLEETIEDYPTIEINLKKQKTWLETCKYYWEHNLPKKEYESLYGKKISILREIKLRQYLIEWFPKDVSNCIEEQVAIGNYYKELGDVSRALTEYKKVVINYAPEHLDGAKIGPHNFGTIIQYYAQALYHVASCYESLGDFDAALIWYEKCRDYDVSRNALYIRELEKRIKKVKRIIDKQ